jgi:hypothetical protein
VSEVKLIGGKADGQVVNPQVALQHGKTFQHVIVPRIWAAATANEASETIALGAETYRVVRFTLDSGSGGERFIAVPVEWSDAQAFDRLLARYRGEEEAL